MLYYIEVQTAKYPWHMRRSDFLSRSDTLPRPRYERELPANYSEAEMHRVTMVNRQREQLPPEVPQHEIGAWMLCDDDSLEQLRLVPIASLPMREEPNRYTIAKYADWYAAGSLFPPIRVVETRYQRLAVTDGHHRIEAAKMMGLTHIPAWVALTWYNRDGANVYQFDSVYYPLVTAKAFAFGWCDAETVNEAFVSFRDVMLQLCETPLPFSWYAHDATTHQLKTLLHYQIVEREYGKHAALSLKLTAAGQQIAEVLS